MDANEILAKSDGTTSTTLHLNGDGAAVHVGDNATTTRGNLVMRDYNAGKRACVGSFATDGNRVAAIYSTNSAIGFQSQWGTTGTTYSNRTVAASSSDIRLKLNIHDTEVDSALDALNRIKVRSFDWIDRLEHQKIGFIADEMEEVDPKFAMGGGYDEDGNMDIKSVNTFYLQGYIVKAIQELSAENTRLKEKVALLEERIASLESN